MHTRHITSFLFHPAGLLSILLLCVGLSPWDHRPMYVAFLVCLGGLLAGLTRLIGIRANRSSSFFLGGITLVSFITGLVISQLQFSPLVRAMISGKEFTVLGGIALGLMSLDFLWKKRWGLSSMSSIATLGIIWMSGPPLSQKLPTLNGPYAVGTTALDWRDSSRVEYLTQKPDDLRRLLIQFFYPGMSDPTAPYLSFKDLRRVLGQSQLNLAPHSSGPWPVIFYSAGLGGSRLDNQSQCEALASQGYLVVATSHPYFNTVIYPDGHRVKAWSMDALEDNSVGPEFIESIMHPIWEADIQSMYKLVEEQAASPEGWLYQKVDFNRVGVMGWSLGGSAAVAICAKDERFHAGINIDGFGWMPLQDSLKLQKPFLYFRSDMREVGKMALFASRKDQATLDSMDRRQTMREEFLLGQQEAPGFSITYKEAYHSNFRDHGLLGLSSLGPIDPKVCNRRLTTQITGFFDQFLRQKPSTNWWDLGASSVFRRVYP